METDISVCLEVKNKLGLWESRLLYKQYQIPGKTFPGYTWVNVYKTRDYDMFYALANVRANGRKGPTLSRPRGLPNDVSREVRAIHSREFGYAASYAKIIELVEFGANNNTGVFNHLITCVQSYSLFVDASSLYPHEKRIVFWFDC